MDSDDDVFDEAAAQSEQEMELDEGEHTLQRFVYTQSESVHRNLYILTNTANICRRYR